MQLTPLEFDQHRKVIFLNDPKYGIEGFVSIHRNNNGHPSFGATRIFPYKTLNEALNDSLRLSRLMTYKSLMAGLPYGGAKATLVTPKDPSKLNIEFFHRFADLITKLGGDIITGADIGVTQENVQTMSTFSPYFIGLRVDPVMFTVRGIVEAMRCASDYVFGTTNLQARSVAIQGLGKIGSQLVKQLYSEVDQIIACDIDDAVVKEMTRHYPKIKIVSPEKIYQQYVDVFSPCALYGTLNDQTIPLLRCKIVCGGANNQLSQPSDGERMRKKNILYCPDFITNSGGLISVTDEYEYKRRSADRVIKKIMNIPSILTSIFEQGAQQHLPTNQVAENLAHTLIREQFGS